MATEVGGTEAWARRGVSASPGGRSVKSPRDRRIAALAAAIAVAVAVVVVVWPHRVAQAEIGTPLTVKGMQVRVDARRDVNSLPVGETRVHAEGVFVVLTVTVTTTSGGQREVPTSLFRVADNHGSFYDVSSVTSDLLGGEGWGLVAQRGQPQSLQLIFDVPPGFAVRWLEVAPLPDTPDYAAAERFTVAGRIDLRMH